MNERYELTIERIRGIVKEETVPVLYREYFQCVAEFILEIDAIRKRLQESRIVRWKSGSRKIQAFIGILLTALMKPVMQIRLMLF